MTDANPLQFNPKSLYLSGLNLYLDAHAPKAFSFISHAHADHFSAHERILCSKPTAHLLEKRFHVSRQKMRALDWRTPFEMDGHTLTLFPAGHIAGSAMIRISHHETGYSLLYTGDFKTRPSFTAETPVFPHADVLVMESTFGRPEYVFPPTEDIHRRLIAFTRETLEDGYVPIILGYSLGKAQEAHAILAQAGIPAVLHNTVFEMDRAFAELGIYQLPAPIRMGKTIPPGHALIAPPNLIRSRAIRSLKNKRSVMLSGWALNPSAIFRYQTDEVIPLSDHADFPGLLEAVDKIKPSLVYTLHGSTREFAASLRQRGYEAWSIYGDDQLELLGKENREISLVEMPRPDSPLADLTRLLDAVRENSSSLKKTELLAGYIANLPENELRHVVNWLRETRQNRIGPSIIKQGILQAAALPLAYYRTISAQQNDSARTGRILLEQAKLSPTPITLPELHEEFSRIDTTSIQLEKIALLTGLLKKNHPREAETIIRLASGGIRAGVKDGVIEDAIAEAFSTPASEVRRAHMLTGDLSETAVLAKNGRLHSATLQVGTPLKPMLASPATDIEKILSWHDKLEGDDNLWAEEKYDGIRAQLHVSKTEAHLFSRDLKTLDDQFPELIRAARFLPPCILDGEIIAFMPGENAKKLTFNDIQKRLGKKSASLEQGDLFGGPSIPVSFVAFDCLWVQRTADSRGWDQHEAQNLHEQALTIRRAELERIALQHPFQRIAVQRISPRDAATLEASFKAALKSGNEGLILKDEQSAYHPGRRGRAWMKLKGVLPTLDCVVIAAQQGHGKRAGVLSDYTFAIRDESTGSLLTLGKAYSGLTDEEIETLTAHFQRRTIGRPQRRVHEVEPDVVLEIAFDRISPSKRHNSGLALRFPRIKAIRHDKTVDDIDTLATARSLVAP